MFQPGLAALLLIAVAGCGVFRSKADIAMQKSPAFQNGYNDGCASANAENTNLRGSARRDDALYASDKIYRNGWQSGFSACRSNYSDLGGSQRGPIPDPSFGH